MFLANRTVKGVGFSHPLRDLDLPARLSDERLEVLVRELRDGTINKSGREELAEGHVRLAMDVVGRYLVRASHKRDVLVAEAMYAIAYAIDRAPTKLRDNNFTAYCVGCVHRFVVHELLEGHMGAVSHSQYSRLKQRGLPTNGHSFTALQDEHVVQDQSKLFDLQEAVTHSMKTDLERAVICKRLEGLSDAEIGDQLDYSDEMIRQIRLRVGRRLKGELCQ